MVALVCCLLIGVGIELKQTFGGNVTQGHVRQCKSYKVWLVIILGLVCRALQETRDILPFKGQRSKARKYSKGWRPLKYKYPTKAFQPHLTCRRPLLAAFLGPAQRRPAFFQEDLQKTPGWARMRGMKKSKPERKEPNGFEHPLATTTPPKFMETTWKKLRICSCWSLFGDGGALHFFTSCSFVISQSDRLLFSRPKAKLESSKQRDPL